MAATEPRSFHLRKSPATWAAFWQRVTAAGLSGSGAVGLFVDKVAAGELLLSPPEITPAESDVSDSKAP